MMKLCGDSVCRPLKVIFNDCLNEGKFLPELKNGKIVPVHEKGDKQCLKVYWPISLMPICSKIFARLIYNEIFTFFTDNNFISSNLSGLRPDDPWVKQLLAITH